MGDKQGGLKEHDGENELKLLEAKLKAASNLVRIRAPNFGRKL
jgi:hypothetical protein